MVRKAQAADLDKIEQSYQEHFAYERAHGAFTVMQEGVYPTRQDAARAIEQESMYVYEENGLFAGSVILNKIQPKEYFTIKDFLKVPKERVMVVHLLMVRPSMAGKGIATALLKYAVALAKKEHCQVLRLDTGAQNIPAVSLYEKMGFQIKETAPMQVGGAISHQEHLFLELEVM